MKKTKKLPPVVDLSTLSPCINNEYHEDYYKKANGVLVGRIYPNKEQKQKIEDILHGVRVFYNCSLYDAKHGLRNVKEFHGYKVPDFSAMAKKEHLDYMRENNPCIRCVPATALSGKSGIILKNAVVSYKKSQFKSIDKWQPNYFRR